MSEEVNMEPISPEEGAMPPKVVPFGEAPAAAAPAAPAPAAAAESAPTVKLKPVIRKPMIHKPVLGAKPAAPAAPAAAAPAAAATAKKATQNLKGVTGPIPAQAVLKKTGIVAEGILTPAQAQAAKSKTSRISLESAIGVAPVKESPAPLKTIRLRRPTNLNAAASSAAPAPAAAAEAPVADLPPVAEAAPTEVTAGAADSTVTQKKTLKLQRPGGSGALKRPTLGVKKPSEAAASTAAATPDAAPVDDIPDIPSLDMASVAAPAKGGVAAGPKWLSVLSLVSSIAAMLVIGFVVYLLFSDGPFLGPNT